MAVPCARVATTIPRRWFGGGMIVAASASVRLGGQDGAEQVGLDRRGIITGGRAAATGRTDAIFAGGIGREIACAMNAMREHGVPGRSFAGRADRRAAVGADDFERRIAWPGAVASGLPAIHRTVGHGRDPATRNRLALRAPAKRATTSFHRSSAGTAPSWRRQSPSWRQRARCRSFASVWSFHESGMPTRERVRVSRAQVGQRI